MTFLAMRRTFTHRGTTYGIALGASEGTRHPANRDAPRVIRSAAPTGGLVARWYRWGRVWRVR